MIKNILFDMVGVLMRFDTDHYIRKMGLGDADVRILDREVFRSLEWAMQDRGTISEEEAIQAICGRTPARLHSAVQDFICRRGRPILPVEGMEALLKKLSEKGCHLFLLSNANLRQHEFWPDVPGNQYFEDTLISADVHLVKPQTEIYRLACEKFRLLPEESAFIDDMPINAEGAHFIGMHAFVFHNDMDELAQWLRSLGVDI